MKQYVMKATISLVHQSEPVNQTLVDGMVSNGTSNLPTVSQNVQKSKKSKIQLFLAQVARILGPSVTSSAFKGTKWSDRQKQHACLMSMTGLQIGINTNHHVNCYVIKVRTLVNFIAPPIRQL